MTDIICHYDNILYFTYICS